MYFLPATWPRPRPAAPGIPMGADTDRLGGRGPGARFAVPRPAAPPDVERLLPAGGRPLPRPPAWGGAGGCALLGGPMPAKPSPPAAAAMPRKPPASAEAPLEGTTTPPEEGKPSAPRPMEVLASVSPPPMAPSEPAITWPASFTDTNGMLSNWWANHTTTTQHNTTQHVPTCQIPPSHEATAQASLLLLTSPREPLGTCMSSAKAGSESGSERSKESDALGRVPAAAWAAAAAAVVAGLVEEEAKEMPPILSSPGRPAPGAAAPPPAAPPLLPAPELPPGGVYMAVEPKPLMPKAPAPAPPLVRVPPLAVEAEVRAWPGAVYMAAGPPAEVGTAPPPLTLTPAPPPKLPPRPRKPSEPPRPNDSVRVRCRAGPPAPATPPKPPNCVEAAMPSRSALNGMSSMLNICGVLYCVVSWCVVSVCECV